jgi:hypothetical protein
MRMALILFLLLSCAKKKQPENPIKERPEILSEEEVEEFPEAGEP